MTSSTSKDLLVQLDNNVVLSQKFGGLQIRLFLLGSFQKFGTDFLISSPGIYCRIFINIMFNPQWSPTVQLLLGWLLILEVVANQIQTSYKSCCVRVYIFILALFRSPNHKYFFGFHTFICDVWRLQNGDPEPNLRFLLASWEGVPTGEWVFDRQITILPHGMQKKIHVGIAGVGLANDFERWYFVHNKQHVWIFDDSSQDLWSVVRPAILYLLMILWFLGSFSTLPLRFRRPIEMLMAIHNGKKGKHPVSRFLRSTLFSPTICQSCRAHLETENNFPQKLSTFLSSTWVFEGYISTWMITRTGPESSSLRRWALAKKPNAGSKDWCCWLKLACVSWNEDGTSGKIITWNGYNLLRQ